MLRNHGRRIAGSDLLCQPGLFFAFTGIAQELVDVELAGTREHALPTYVSTEFVMQIMPKLGLKVVCGSEVGVPALGGKWMMCDTVPIQSCFAQPGAGRDHRGISFGSGLSRRKHREVALQQLGKTMCVLLQIVDQVDLAEAEFAFEDRRLDDPRQIGTFD